MRAFPRQCLSAVAASLVAVFAPVSAHAQSAAAAEPSRDSLPPTYRARERSLSASRFATLWTASSSHFRRTWDASAAADRDWVERWRESLPADVAELERRRTEWQYLWGRILWPYFHWRETAAASVPYDADAARKAASLLSHDSRWWSISEHAALTGALVHEHARMLRRTTPALRVGDAQWLRAELAATRALFPDSLLQADVATRLLLAHLDDNDERGVDSVLGSWRAMVRDTVQHRRVDSLIAAASSLRRGHDVAVYQRVRGVPLEVHVLRPTTGDSMAAGPAMLWFHGGSYTTGSWSHSPGMVRALRERGITVLAVEYRTGARFDAGPVEQYADAVAAWQYVRSHAETLRIDTTRVGAAGFSSGAVLALLLGTKGERVQATSGKTAARRYPNAIIVSGTCVDPTGPSEDGYFRKMVRRVAPAQTYSPRHLLARGQPPMLLVHAAQDEYCRLADAEDFTQAAHALGIPVTLSRVEGASHFFGFYFRPGQQQMRGAIDEALLRWGWSAGQGERR